MSSLDDMNIQWLPRLRAVAQWPAWSAQMKGALVFMGAWSIVQPPSSDGSTASSENRDLIRYVQYLIKERTEHWFHFRLTGSNGTNKAPHEMWEALKSFFDPKSNIGLFIELENLMMYEGRMSEQEPLEPQMDTIVYRMHKLHKDGLKLDDHTRAFLLLSKLPESYQSAVSDILRTVEAKDLSVETIFPKIILEESARKIWKAGDQGESFSSSRNQSRKKGPCDYCGGETHHESGCWYKDPEKKPKKKEN
jgi:hypothetical protein